jgi:hypothetical protein
VITLGYSQLCDKTVTDRVAYLAAHDRAAVRRLASVVVLVHDLSALW